MVRCKIDQDIKVCVNQSPFENVVRNPGGSKVEDELYEKKGKWDETEPEEEEDGLREEDNQYQYGFHIYRCKRISPLKISQKQGTNNLLPRYKGESR